MKIDRQNRGNRGRLEIWSSISAPIFVVLLVTGILLPCYANVDDAADNSAILSVIRPAHRDLLAVGADANDAVACDNESAYSRFPHNNQIHSEISCLICHRRPTNSPRMRLPGGDGHTPCIGCHTQQFADNTSPICSICHVNAETGSVKAFPPLRSFSAKFDHSTHLRVTNCATCHKPQRNGVAKSIPQGAGTHATCFQCHRSQSRERMSSCSVCHKPGRIGPSTSEWAKAFTVSFSHAKHNLNCNTCHTLQPGKPRGSQMTRPLASMHFAPKNRQACGTCHDNEKAFGGVDFSDCQRCHTGTGFRFPQFR